MYQRGGPELYLYGSLCGVFLLLMTLTLAIFMIYFVWRIRIFRHHEITTIVIAAYTFASLTLENAMLMAFGEANSERFRRIMLGATGVAVVLVVQGMAVY